jgi:hypothetical protein
MKVKIKKEKPVAENGKATGLAALLQKYYNKYSMQAIAPGLMLVILALYLLDIFDINSITLIIGETFLLFMFGVFVYKVLASDFKKWCKIGVYVSIPFFLLSMVFPFFRMIYPGEAVVQKELTNETKEMEIQGIEEGSDYRIIVEATNFPESEYNNARGDYHIILGGKDIKGTFSDEWKTTRVGRRGSRQVERKHLAEHHLIHIDSPADKLVVSNLDSRMGGKVNIKIYSSVMPLPLEVTLIILLICFALVFDIAFQDLTKKLLLSPFVGICGLFLLFFEPDTGIQGVIWIIILSCTVGFLGGWLVTWIFRKIFNKYIKAKIYA